MEKDVVDELMPDPEGTEDEDAQAHGDDIEVVIAADDDEGDAQHADSQHEGSGEDQGVDLNVEEDEDEQRIAAAPKSIQDRIRREINIRKQAEASAAEQVAQANSIAVKAVKDRIEAQLFMAGMAKEHLNNRLEAMTTALERAKEDGDTKAEVKLIAEMDDARAKLRETLASQSRLESERANPPVPVVDTESHKWVGSNRWYSDGRFGTAAAAAQQIDRTLLAENKIPRNTPAYYRELDRRLHMEMPTLRKRAVEVGLIAGKAASSSAPRTVRPTSGAAPVRSAGSSQGIRANKNQVVLHKSDFEKMQKFGLDPSNKEHQKAYAKEIRG